MFNIRLPTPAYPLPATLTALSDTSVQSEDFTDSRSFYEIIRALPFIPLLFIRSFPVCDSLLVVSFTIFWLIDSQLVADY